MCGALAFHHGPRPLTDDFHACSLGSPLRLSSRSRVLGRFHARQISLRRCRRMFRSFEVRPLLRPRLTSLSTSLCLAASVALAGIDRDLPGYHTCASRPACRIYTSPFRAAAGLTELRQLSQTLCLISDSCLSGWRFAIGFLHRFVASSTLPSY